MGVGELYDNQAKIWNLLQECMNVKLKTTSLILRRQHNKKKKYTFTTV